MIAELSERGLDLVPVVDRGELVGCLMEKEIAHLLEDDVTEDAQLQGATLPLEKPYLEISPWTLWKKRSVWLLLLFVAEAYTSSVLQHFGRSPGIGHRAGLLYSAAHRHRRQQRNADHLDAGALDGAGGSATARYGAGDPQRGIDLVSDCPDPGSGGLSARLDDGIGMEITLIVSLTLVCITLWSAIVSSVIPMVLKRIGIDPAVVSAPFIATLIDGTGLIIYFKIAQYFLGLN
ncbi:magnesium transporter [Klebsiella pneumoniae]|uniref:Magnesium transporter n=1 Tax=Klebsiella pneumoniae TaxID=573 RepID=A0A378FS00_KLEPN|nr:magnesium transporter [Klebsiella pneumoniae]